MSDTPQNKLATRFDVAVDFVIRHEGGWSEDAADRGGPTRWGISQRAFPDVDLEHLDRDGAVRIYREHYWDRMRCGEMPPPLDLVLMDSAVNCGRRRTTLWLQEYCNHLGGSAASPFPGRGPGRGQAGGSGRTHDKPARPGGRDPLKLDGIMGPVTARAVLFCPVERLVPLMLYRRQLHYLNLRRRYPQYLAGWLGRTTDLLLAIGSERGAGGE